MVSKGKGGRKENNRREAKHFLPLYVSLGYRHPGALNMIINCLRDVILWIADGALLMVGSMCNVDSRAAHGSVTLTAFSSDLLYSGLFSQVILFC